MQRPWILLGLCAVVLTWGVPARAQETEATPASEAQPQEQSPAEEQPQAQEQPPQAQLSAREIMDRVEHANDVATEVSTMDMTLTNKRGQTRERKMRAWTKSKDEDLQDQLVRFLEPKDVEGVGLLTWEHADRDDDQWLYLPALHKVRRISSADQSDSFMGTDFSFQDMRSEKLDEHTYTIQREEAVEGRPCWVVEAVASTPKQQEESGYGRRVIWVDQATFLQMKAEYYDKKGQLLKEFEAGNMNEVAPGKWRHDMLYMENVQRGHNTRITFTNRSVGEEIDPDVFTERELRRAH